MIKKNNSKVKKIYIEKIKLLKKYNESYYNESNPIVEDVIYDRLKNEILSLEKKYLFLSSNDSPSTSVGFKPSKNFKKVMHKTPMLSLNNAFNKDDLLNFEKKIFNFLSLDSSNRLEYSAEPKIDGISASLLYKNFSPNINFCGYISTSKNFWNISNSF